MQVLTKPRDDVDVVEPRSFVVVSLPQESELVFTVPLDEGRSSASIKVISPASGNEPRVDVFGAPIIPDVQYRLLPGCTLVVFSWSSATIRIEGSEELLSSVYRPAIRSLTRPIVEYHCLIHTARTEAQKKGNIGPITLVCGSDYSGKRSLARSLCNYAARAGWKPFFADLDCGVGQSLSIPGTVAGGIIEYPLTVDQVLSLSLVVLPLFVGSIEPQKMDDNLDISVCPPYVNAAHRLLQIMKDRLDAHIDNLYASSGAIVLMPELRDNAGVNFVGDVAERFGISNILCVGDDYLFHKLHARFVRPQVAITKGSLNVRVDKISQSYNFPPLPSADVLLPNVLNGYFHGFGSVVLLPSQWSKELSKLDVLQICEENGLTVLSTVEREALQGIVGCIGALYHTSQSTSALQAAPFAFARVQAIDPSGVSLLTTTHHTFSNEKLTLVVGSMRWITS